MKKIANIVFKGSGFRLQRSGLPSVRGSLTLESRKLKIPSFSAAFTLIEVLVAVSVLMMMVAIIAQLFSSATSVATLGNKRMDSDAQARAVLDRMAVDFGRMVRRPDVDYYVKDSATPMAGGNDQLAFYAEAPGYYPTAAGYASSVARSPISLVGFRMNSANLSLERLGKGLLWSVISPGSSMVFLPSTIKATWPSAADQSADANYEALGLQVFRFEYGYILKGQVLPDGSTLPSIYSAVPWDTRSGVGHTSIQGFRDVSAIELTIAVIDPKSRVQVRDADLQALAANMPDFNPATYPAPGDLEVKWQSAIDSSNLPKSAASAIHIYRRTFALP